MKSKSKSIQDTEKLNQLLLDLVGIANRSKAGQVTHKIEEIKEFWEQPQDKKVKEISFGFSSVPYMDVKLEQSKEEQCRFCGEKGLHRCFSVDKPKTEDFVKVGEYPKVKSELTVGSTKTEDTGECDHIISALDWVIATHSETKIKCNKCGQVIDPKASESEKLLQDWENRFEKAWVRQELMSTRKQSQDIIKIFISQEIESARASERAKIKELVEKHKSDFINDTRWDLSIPDSLDELLSKIEEKE